MSSALARSSGRLGVAMPAPSRARAPRVAQRRPTSRSASLSRPSRPRAALLGAHMSIAGGLYRSIERGAALGCGAVQIFLKNQRQWAASPVSADDVQAFRAAWRQSDVRAVFAHASYLINLASPGEAQWRQAVDAFTDE